MATIIEKLSRSIKRLFGLEVKYISYVIPFEKYRNSISDYYDIGLIRSSIDYIANSTAKIPLHFFNGSDVIDDKVALFAQPNATQTWTSFVNTVFKQKLLNGYCIIQLNKDGLFIINENIAEPINTDTTKTLYFSHPANPTQITPIPKSIEPIIKRHIKSLEAMQQYLDNSIFAGILSVEYNNNTYVDAKMLDDAESELQKKYSGAKNFGKVGLVKYPLKFTKTAMSVEESGILEFYYRDLQDISRAFGIPSVLLGDTTNSTYNNIKEARIRFYEDTIMPQLDEFCEIITKLLSKFFAKIGYPKAYLSYFKQSIPNERNDKLVDIYLKMYEKGNLTKDELLNYINSLIIQ